MQQAPVTSDIVPRALKGKACKRKAPSGKHALQEHRAVRPDGDVLQDAALASAKPGRQPGVGHWQKALRRVG